MSDHLLGAERSLNCGLYKAIHYFRWNCGKQAAEG
jgi:hypothetical protein